MAVSGESSSLIELGVVGAPFGVRGWVKLRSFTDPPDRLLQHRSVQLLVGGSWVAYKIEASGRSGGQLTAELSGGHDRGQAGGFRGAQNCVSGRGTAPAGAQDVFSGRPP